MPRVKNRNVDALVDELARQKVAMFPELDKESVKKIIREQLQVIENLRNVGLV